MSIEYTIDIQLTELGFPDILQPQETSVRETSRHSITDGSFPPSHSPPSLSNTNKKKLLVKDLQSADGDRAGLKQNSDNQPITGVSPPPGTYKPVNAALGLRDDQTDKETAASKRINNSTAGHKPTNVRTLRITEGADGPRVNADGNASQDASGDLQHVGEIETDDSDVSEVYDEEEIDEDEEDEEEKESGNSADYHCSVCDLQLATKFKLQDHMNLHTGARPYCCAECGKRFCQSYNYRVHLRTHAQAKVDRLRCRICRRAFASQEELTDHLSKTHFENEFYECDQCKRVFTSLTECEYHVQLQKCMLDVCEMCGRSFSSPRSLARHRKRVCYCNFKCTDCSKVFTKKNALLRHSFSHLGLLPYTCVRCRCHFRLAKLYRQHKCEPQRINCVACLRQFFSEEDFQRHKRHTGCWGNQEPKGDEIRCLECGQLFDTKDELKKHAGAHQRVLKCAECGKGFRSALLLMSHMGGHAGQSPCLCQSCGLGFPHQQNYHSHLKTCGQTPHPTSAPKKRLTSKNSSTETQKPKGKSDSLSPVTRINVPASGIDGAASPAKDSVSPKPVTERVSPDCGQSDGLWKLTLDKEPPPGVNLVLFLPVGPTQTNDLTLQSRMPQPLPVSAVQVTPEVSLSPVPSNKQLGVSPAYGVPQSIPPNLGSGIKPDPECEEPLDLSKKYSVVSDVPHPPIKCEAEEFEVTKAENGTERKAVVEASTEATMDPMDLSTFSKISPDVKKEPNSPGCGVSMWPSESSELTEGRLEEEKEMVVE